MMSDEKQQEILEGIRQFKKDFILMHDLAPELKKKHPNQWLAVYQGQVYLAADYDSFVKTLRESGVPKKDAATMRLSLHEHTIVLWAR